MNLMHADDRLSSHALREEVLMSSLSEILKACESSKYLMVSIYLIEKDRFLFCNRNLIDHLGKQLSTFWKEGWDFWQSKIDNQEAPIYVMRIREFIKSLFTQDSLTLNYHVTSCAGKKIYLEHEIYLCKIRGYTLAFNYFSDVSDRERIEKCFRVHNTYDNHECSKRVLRRISVREQEVLQLIASGYSSKEIAAALFISNHTAISHRKNLIQKFKVKNTAHLVRKAVAYI
ncbi:MAG: LuxR C-terminal-related transcriptional regulator [Pricia sp.]